MRPPDERIPLSRRLELALLWLSEHYSDEQLLRAAGRSVKHGSHPSSAAFFVARSLRDAVCADLVEIRPKTAIFAERSQGKMVGTGRGDVDASSAPLAVPPAGGAVDA